MIQASWGTVRARSASFAVTSTERRGAAQVELLELRAETVHVAVRVVQAGQDGAPAGVDHPRRRAAPGQRLGVAADVDQAVAGDRHRFGARGGISDGVDDAVMDDEIGGSGHAVLCWSPCRRAHSHRDRRRRSSASMSGGSVEQGPSADTVAVDPRHATG